METMVRLRSTCLALCLGLLLASPQPALAWDAVGHRLTAAVALRVTTSRVVGVTNVKSEAEFDETQNKAMALDHAIQMAALNLL